MSNLIVYYAIIDYLPRPRTYGICYECCACACVIIKTHGSLIMQILANFMVFWPLTIMLMYLVNNIIDSRNCEKITHQEPLVTQSNILLKKVIEGFDYNNALKVFLGFVLYLLYIVFFFACFGTESLSTCTIHHL